MKNGSRNLISKSLSLLQTYRSTTVEKTTTTATVAGRTVRFCIWDTTGEQGQASLLTFVRIGRISGTMAAAFLKRFFFHFVITLFHYQGRRRRRRRRKAK